MLIRVEPVIGIQVRHEADEREVLATVSIPDGKHTGKIVNVSYRNDKFPYVDLHVAVDGTVKDNGGQPVVIKAGVPDRVSGNTALGRLIHAFTGDELEVGTKVSPTKVFTGRKVSFSTSTEDNDAGSFARINTKTLKPLA